MHEYSIAQSIMQIVLSEAEKANARKVLKVSLGIGDLAGVFPDALSFCFDLLAKGTVAEDAKLIIEKVPIGGHCSHCNKTFRIENNLYICPICKTPNIKVTTGRELQINHLEIDDETD